MPFTGSATTLEGLIIAEMYANELMKVTDPPEAQDNMKKWAKTIAAACENWILASGVNSIVATVAPGQLVVGTTPPTVVATPSPVSGSTTSPGSIATSSLV